MTSQNSSNIRNMTEKTAIRLNLVTSFSQQNLNSWPTAVGKCHRSALRFSGQYVTTKFRKSLEKNEFLTYVIVVPQPKIL